MLNDTLSRIDFTDAIGKLWNAKWKILFFQFCVAVACIGVILFWPRIYKSEAKLYLQLGRETIGIDPTASTGSMVSVQSNSREDEIISAMEVIKSRGVVGKVVDELTPEVAMGKATSGTAKSSVIGSKIKESLGYVASIVAQIDPTSSREKAIIEIEESLEVRAERKSEVIVVEFEADSPQLAQLIVATLLETYQKEHLRLHRTDGSQNFFEEQQRLLSEELNNANDKLKLAKNRMGIASITGQRDLLESRNKDISQSLAETERVKFEIEARVQKIRNDLASIPERINSVQVQKSNNATDLQAQQMFALQLTEAEYSAKFQDSNPRLISIREQLKQAESRYKEKATKTSESSDDVNPIYRDLSLDLLKSEAQQAGIESKLQALEIQRIDNQKRLQEINSHDIEIADLEREVRIHEKKYVTYTESLEQARINQELETGRISSVVIAQDATLQERPVSPSKVVVVAAGLALMLAGSFLLGMASVRFDDRMMTAESVRNRLGIPVLATLPKSRLVARSS